MVRGKNLRIVPTSNNVEMNNKDVKRHIIGNFREDGIVFKYFGE